jgi:hypothetical protein
LWQAPEKVEERINGRRLFKTYMKQVKINRQQTDMPNVNCLDKPCNLVIYHVDEQKRKTNAYKLHIKAHPQDTSAFTVLW